MAKLIECVPNFSEGRDLNKIKLITDEINKIDNVTLLDVDPGVATNRTVVTFIGEPEAVIKAAFNAIKKAAEIIDMRTHKGTHARMGATDVCPLVPVSGITMEECSKFAIKLGKMVGENLKIPVYLYEESAQINKRKNLAYLRSGEYEALEEKLKNPEWKPDFGEPFFNAKSGATVIGAREFLVAYNINLNTKNKKLAHDIALEIREKGRFKRDKNNKILKDKNGEKLRTPGLFEHVKAVGWFIDEYNTAQISINFTNYKITPVHIVVDKVRELALSKGLIVTGCELVGLIPLDAMISAGQYYLKKQNISPGLNDNELISTAVRSLGLNDLSPFKPEEKIIDFLVSEKYPLAKLSLQNFCDETASESLAPGGGSVAALSGALAASLGAMVCNLTIGKKKYKHNWEELGILSIECQKIKKELMVLIDKDTEAFYKIISAGRLPEKTEKEIINKKILLQNATENAINIPFTVLSICHKLIIILEKIANLGNQNSISDIGVAILNCTSAAQGANLNILINLNCLEDLNLKTKYLEESKAIEEKIISLGNILNEKIKKIIKQL
jgi:glutamate formiminotransferase/formiminotetrahydrofolate cyclodeaminase